MKQSLLEDLRSPLPEVHRSWIRIPAVILLTIPVIIIGAISGILDIVITLYEDCWRGPSPIDINADRKTIEFPAVSPYQVPNIEIPEDLLYGEPQPGNSNYLDIETKERISKFIDVQIRDIKKAISISEDHDVNSILQLHIVSLNEIRRQYDISYTTETCNGITKYFKDGLLHREDGPAKVCTDGSVEYYKNGLLHREDGPASITFNKNICADGPWCLIYFKDGTLHREDGPASIRYIDDQCTDGPSVQMYFKDGTLHREDGPAIVSTIGPHQYYLNDKLLSEEEFNQIMNNK